MAEWERSWQVEPDHPAFAGHFPGNPIVPGVVVLDQALLFAQAHLGHSDRPWQVTQAKFLSPCGPGDSLVFAFKDGARGGLSFVVRCGVRDVASGHLEPV